jgi:hypothetical protein
MRFRVARSPRSGELFQSFKTFKSFKSLMKACGISDLFQQPGSEGDLWRSIFTDRFTMNGWDAQGR